MRLGLTGASERAFACARARGEYKSAEHDEADAFERDEGVRE